MTGTPTIRVFSAVLVLLLIVLTLIFSYTRDNEPLLIGFVGGLSGKFADLGIDCRRGVELAVAKVNGEGGINGRPIKLIARDDGQDPEQARIVVGDFIKMNLPVVIGHATSSMSMATLPLINDSDTLLVSPTTSTPLLKNMDDNFVRTCVVSTDAAIMMAKYLRKIKKAQRVGVIYDLSNSAYTEYWYRNFRETFLETGGREIIPVTFDSAPDLQMLPLVNRVRMQTVDALVIVANSVDAALFCQQVRKIGWSIPLVLADWAATEQLISLGGKAVEGAVVSQYFNRKSREPAYIDFKKFFEAAYKAEPGFGAVHSYNAAMMIFTAMTGQQDDENLKEAILRISTFDGLQGSVSINSYGDSSNPTFIGEINNGNFVILEEFR